MSATTVIAARLADCRAILGCCNNPDGIAWNRLKPGMRAALLKAADLSEGSKHRRWEELSTATQHRIRRTAIEADGLRRFIDAARSIAAAEKPEVLQ